MFTTVDKAATATITGILSILVQTGVVHLSPDTATAITSGLAVLTPLLVYLIPNRPKAQ